MRMHVLLLPTFCIIFFIANSGALTYFSVASSSNINQIPDIAPLRVLKLQSSICNRQCVLDNNCWSWYVYSTNGTDNCVLMGTNLRQKPDLTFISSAFSTKWWQKLLDSSIPRIAANQSSTTAPVQFLPVTVSNVVTTKTVTITRTSTSMSLTIPMTLPPQLCDATTCKSCQSCELAACCTSGPDMVDRTGIVVCTIWPNGTYSPTITLPCVQKYNPVLLYRKVQVNTTSVTEFVLTPQEMYMVSKTVTLKTFEIRYRTLTSGNTTKCTQYTSMSINSAGELSLNNFLYDPDPFGVPLMNVPFVSHQFDPACGPFWDLVNSSVANNGTAFDASPCPGYRTAFYGKPGFYNGTWRSGIAFASLPNEIITEIFVWLW